ncbi:putative ribonuclease H-like domain-containing protein [Tanacetum coccineum]
MQDELLQFKLQKVWTLVDLPNGKMAIRTKWVYKNKKNEKAIRLFLAYASFKDFVVYQMDVKSANYMVRLKRKSMFVNHQDLKIQTSLTEKVKGGILLVQVYVDDIIFGSTKKSLCMKFEKMMHKKFQMSSMGELTFFLGLQVKKKEDGIFISQDKYVTEILKKFSFIDVKTASTPMETHKPLLKEADGEDVDEHLYRSMIGSLMYLTSSRPDIMFIVYACARYQVNLKVSHLQAVKRIFRYLKGQPKLGLWYPKDSPFNLVAYTDSGYARASLDRKSTIEGCQFLGCRLILCQCKKQTVVANSTTKADYIAASNCCGQVLWIQNQFMDYGYNFMQTKIHIDNESTICIVKNPVFHSKTKHIEIRHHFIRDSNKKKLIQMIKIHTDQNVVDLLTKAFDVTDYYTELVIGMDAKAAKDGTFGVRCGLTSKKETNAAGTDTRPLHVGEVTTSLGSFGYSTVKRKNKLEMADTQLLKSFLGDCTGRTLDYRSLRTEIDDNTIPLSSYLLLDTEPKMFQLMVSA